MRIYATKQGVTVVTRCPCELPRRNRSYMSGLEKRSADYGRQEQ